jgi:uncharacterized protein
MSQFASLQGDVTMLVTWLALSWTVAAIGETTAFFGFVQTRLTELFGSTGIGLGVAVGLSSLLLGLLHTEYGIVGVTISAIDGVFYGVLRCRHHTLWGKPQSAA